MYLYAFILGRKSLLSVAELCSVIGDEGKIIDITSQALLATFPDELKNPQTSLNRLGGTIKIAQIFEEDLQDKSQLAQAVSVFLANKFKDNASKFSYGVSAYSFAEKNEIFLRRLLNLVKKNLKSENLKSRFINKNFANLENAAIKGEKLIEKGAEIVLIQGSHKIFCGQTVALQDFENYSHRDFDRPGRDARLGMLPPKLAQIMINLGGLTRIEKEVHPATTLYDPFVGIGTVLTEGILLGYSGIGSDIDAEALKKAQKNIDFIHNQTYIPGQKISLFQHDATSLSPKDLPSKIDLIITESYLGPPVSQFPTPENLHKTHSHIKETILRFFQSLNKIIKPGTPVIISLLVYRKSGRYFYIENLVEKIVNSGFEIAPLINKELQAKYNLGLNSRGSIIYDRPDQIVGREIWKFVKK